MEKRDIILAITGMALAILSVMELIVHGLEIKPIITEIAGLIVFICSIDGYEYEDDEYDYKED